MKKICMVTTVSITMKSFVVEMAKHLHEECGYDVTLICNQDEEFAASLPDYLHFIPVDMERGINLSGFKAIKNFRKIFRREKFDMVQYATPNASCYASIAAKLEKVPIRLYCQWGIRYVGLSGLSRKIFKQIEKVVCRLSTHVRAVSRMNKQFGVSEGLYKSQKATVVGNGGTIGVNMQEYDVEQKSQWRKDVRVKHGLQSDEVVFGFAGRISADKGCSEMLLAFRSIVEEYPEARLFVVGPLEANCGVDAELVEWAQRSHKVTFTGRVDNRDMRMYYAAMDVLVHPTYREGFGMVIQEAGAMGVPAITTRIPGASEVMEEGVSCLLVEPKSADDLAKGMRSVLEDNGLLKSLGDAAYQRTKQLYNRPVMLHYQRMDYERLLREEEDV